MIEFDWLFFSFFSWFYIGFFSFTFWYLHDFDLTLGAFIVGCLASSLGPLAFLLGWGIHGEPFDFQEIILFKKRVPRGPR